MPKRSSPSLLSAAHLEAMTECQSYASLPAYKQVRRLPTASSDFSLSDSEDDDDDETSSVLSSCGSSASEESLLSCASSRAVPDAGDLRELKPQEHSNDRYLSGDALSTHADAAIPAHVKRSLSQMPYPVDAGQLAQLNVPTTNDLDEALRSNGLLAYVPSTDIGLQKPAQHLGKPAATTLPTGQSWAFSGGDLFSGEAPLASCPCFMCKAHGCSSAPVQFGTHPQAPPGSPGSFESEECSFRAPIPSSLAIAAALAAGEMPFLSRPEQLAVPPVTGVLPMFFTAALLMANTGVPMGQQPGQLCQTAIPLPRRPIDLPLSSPSLLEGPSVPVALHQ